MNDFILKKAAALVIYPCEGREFPGGFLGAGKRFVEDCSARDDGDGYGTEFNRARNAL
ncbi:hypothetical protein [Marinobacterium jannaschii]|uniref:hypothetical protein n=1 Tax=Marinobacterium jannaschii TaxID=64970 RepID=UPI000A977ED3|nr:hypothetical protein [Marinobacterium jannaschii]